MVCVVQRALHHFWLVPRPAKGKRVVRMDVQVPKQEATLRELLIESQQISREVRRKAKTLRELEKAIGKEEPKPVCGGGLRSELVELRRNLVDTREYLGIVLRQLENPKPQIPTQ